MFLLVEECTILHITPLFETHFHNLRLTRPVILMNLHRQSKPKIWIQIVELKGIYTFTQIQPPLVTAFVLRTDPVSLPDRLVCGRIGVI